MPLGNCKLQWLKVRMVDVTTYSLSRHWSSKEDTAISPGDCTAHDSRVSLMAWPPLTWGCRRQEMQVRVKLSRACWLSTALSTYSGICWYWIGPVSAADISGGISIFELPKCNGISLHHFTSIWSSEVNAEYLACCPLHNHLHTISYVLSHHQKPI